ncbi:hypothetical protein B0F90DRAFT_1865460 [Multifurca ochricompacta]|uniref:DUF3074 domain-containing protein n=1 Tax=Multifurca ochricompacta TaxID=376703 RepID=A0AAD4QS71_9AGAM|nr:hypothetical protein B0F90DRAFT_1865460 [Multifurca ochricompacta]
MVCSINNVELPSDELVIAAGREVLEASQSWKKGKTYQKNTVQTYSRPKKPNDGASWHCRVSEHTPKEATFDEFWSKIGNNHSEYEKQYIDVVKKVTLIKKISETQEIWSLYYEFPSVGVSPRVFTVLQVTHYDPRSPRTGLFISIPVDLTSDPELARLEEKGIKGHYVSVESIKELPNGDTEWRMATSSSPGGRIPAFVVDNTMASTISADVPHFFKWFETVRHVTETKERLPPDSAASNVNSTIITNSAAVTSAIQTPIA